MSKDNQVAQSLRNEESSEAQLQEVPLIKPRVADSDIRELLPDQEGEEMAETRAKVQEVTETRVPTSFEDAMKSVENLEHGDHAALQKLAYRYSGEKLIVCRTEKGKGFKAFAREAKSDDEVLPLTHEQSQQLADALNDKIDFERMEQEAGKKKKKPGKSKQPARQTKSKREAAAHSIEELTEAIPKITSKSELAKLLHYSERNGMCSTDKSAGHLVVVEKEGVNGSMELATAFNDRFEALSNEIKAEDEKRQAEWAVGQMKRANNTPYLRKIIETQLRHMLEVKEGQHRHEWTVAPLSSSQRDLEVAKFATEKKAELREAFFEQRRREKSREDIEAILRKTRR